MLYGTLTAFSWHNNRHKRGVIMKKILIMFASLLLLVSLSGCKSEVSAEDVSKAIANIYSDSEGNVTIALSDGREFSLGNMKGEKGDKGDKGDPGVDGKDGKDGLNGLNGKDGINGADGKDGADGANGKDGVNATPITDYVKDVTLTDENILTITYGDESTEEVNRIELAGQYIFKTYADLHDADDNYVETVLLDYYCYDKGQDITTKIYFPIEYGDKFYNICPTFASNDDIELLGAGGGSEYMQIDWRVPSRDVEYHYEAKEAYPYTLKCKYNDLVLLEYTDYVIAGDSVYATGNNLENNLTYYYCDNTTPSAIESMPKEAVNVTLDYIPVYSTSYTNPHPECLVKIFTSQQETVLRNSSGLSTVRDFKDAIIDILVDEGFDERNIVVIYDAYTTEDTLMECTDFSFYYQQRYGLDLYGSWVNPDAKIYIRFEED